MAQSPLLFTPGPLTTQLETRRAMRSDWGSREPAFITMTAELRRRLLKFLHIDEYRGQRLAALREMLQNLQS